MTQLLALACGVLFACGIYLVLRRGAMQIVFGLAFIGHAANLAIFTAAGLRREPAPLIPVGSATLPEGSADPVPQALVLTAIVIGFAVVSFAAVLARRASELVGTDDVAAMWSTDT